MGMVDRDAERREKKWSGIGGYSRNFDESEFSRFHCNFLATAARENRIKRDEVGKKGGEGEVGRRIASLSAVPRIRTNIFPKQLDCIESEKDRQIQRIRVQADGEEERKGEREERYTVGTHCAQGNGTRDGMENTSCPPPYVSSYLFLLPVYDAPSSAERKERIREEGKGRRGREENRGRRGKMVCQYSLCLRRKRKGEGRGREGKRKMEAKRNGGKCTCGKRARRKHTARKNLQSRERA